MTRGHGGVAGMDPPLTAAAPDTALVAGGVAPVAAPGFESAAVPAPEAAPLAESLRSAVAQVATLAS